MLKCLFFMWKKCDQNFLLAILFNKKGKSTKLYSWKSVFFSMYFQKKKTPQAKFYQSQLAQFWRKKLPFLPYVQRQGNLFSNIVFETEPVLKNGFLFWTERVFKGQQCFKTRVLKKCLFIITKNTGFESLVGVEKNIVFEEEPALKDGFFFWK